MKFIEDLEKKAKKHGVKVLIESSDLVYAKGDPNGSAGYFDSENKVIAVAKKGPIKKWLPILVHESCHLDQWIHDKFLWEKLSLGYDLFFSWLTDRTILKKEVLDECVQDLIRLEFDCELRSIKKIKKYELDIDILEYKKKVNAYLYGYLFILEKRKWVPKIYEQEDVWKAAPSRFPKQYIKIPVKLYRQFKKAYGKFSEK